MGGKQRIGFVYQLRYFVASYLPVATCRDIIKNSKVGTARVGTKLHIHIFIFYTYILSWTNSENFVVVTFLRKLKKRQQFSQKNIETNLLVPTLGDNLDRQSLSASQSDRQDCQKK